MRKFHSIVACAALFFTYGKELSASLVWDYSPATYAGATHSPPSGYGWDNEAIFQNFAERVSFMSSMNLTGMDIYARSSGSGLNNPVSVGTSATIRIWDGSFGTPGISIYDFTRPVSVIDTEGAAGTNVIRIHVDFTSPVVLAAGTQYWIGMSGTSVNIGQLGLSGILAPENSRMYQFDGATPDFQTSTFVGDMAFRLHGDEVTDVTGVPEPASMALLGLTAIGGLGLRWRQRRKARVAQAAE